MDLGAAKIATERQKNVENHLIMAPRGNLYGKFEFDFGCIMGLVGIQLGTADFVFDFVERIVYRA